MSDLSRHLEGQLEALESEGLRRDLREPSGIDFCSNDYLGLASDPAFCERVREHSSGHSPDAPLTSPASRLLRGNLREHRELERRLAEYKGTEDALIFCSGFQANAGVLSTLIGRDDRVLSDSLNHASIIDGLRLSRANRVIYPHLDRDEIERQLRTPWPGGRTFLVTESYFSMDGDIADLAAYADLCDEHGASLIVDDAHAIGVYGAERGSGLAEELGVADRCAAIVSTFGKALASSGAFVAAPRVVIDYLTNCARAFVFSTAVPPILLRTMEVGLDFAERASDRRERLQSVSSRLREKLRAGGADCFESTGPIIPIAIGDSQASLDVAEDVQARGYDVRAIRPPTIPNGTARLRISVHANHDVETIDALAAAVLESLEPISLLK